ncbi:MAG: ATP-binding protein, partial [Candidatus Aerophobetes bacterium]|nr:ATP-binding protein [Candidatus Aerophobetes bacterium]
MRETRVDLLHLLEDIRDGYSTPLEETIVIEIVANSLDARASKILFKVDKRKNVIEVVDDGAGMNSKEFENYHDIAATTKIRGRGIGFAGVGIKLALLVAEKVITETRRKSFHASSEWSLQDRYHAPWEYLNFKTLSMDGTKVVICFKDKSSLLLSSKFIEKVIQNRYRPLLDENFHKIFSSIYPEGVEFKVNRKKLRLKKIPSNLCPHRFFVFLGRRRKAIGIGYILKSSRKLSEEERGIGISTYGKVIKRGWDWLMLNVKDPDKVIGLVEVPELAECLTTNKSDFRKDSTHLKKYYKYRKAIQKVVLKELEKIGEAPVPKEKIERGLRRLGREIQEIMQNLAYNFPELNELFPKTRRGKKVQGVIPDSNAQLIAKETLGVENMTGTMGGAGTGEGIKVAPGDTPEIRLEISETPEKKGKVHTGRIRRSGIQVAFDEDPQKNALGWLVGDTIYINRA